MYLAFESVAIHKPNTSRPANSERYIICKGKRRNTSPIYLYLRQVNVRLNEFGMTILGEAASDTDIVEVVPVDILRQDDAFFKYICESNNVLGERQIIGLAKIAAFCKDRGLFEERQAEMREKCLKRWKVPDETRRTPSQASPGELLQSAWGSSYESLFKNPGTLLMADNLTKLLRSAFDWKFVVLATSETVDRSFFFGSGRTKVFKFNPSRQNRWEKVDDTLKFELPRGTLIYAETVIEMRGEHHSCRRVKAVQIIDAAFIGSQDLRNLDFKTRNEFCHLLAKSVNKSTRKDYVTLRAKTIFGLERLADVFDLLTKRTFKGQGVRQGLTLDIPPLGDE